MKATEFLKSLLSKKLAFAAAAEALIQSLHMSAEWKGICTAAVAIGFMLAQAYVDANTPAPAVPVPPPAPPEPPADISDRRTPTIPPDPKLPRVLAGTLALCLLVAMPLALFATSCGSQADTAAAIQKTEALAFNGAVVSLEVLDSLEAKHLDSIKAPTPADIAQGEKALARLKRARDALEHVRMILSGELKGDERASLREAVEALRPIADELKASGVAVPQRVTDGLQIAALYLGVP